MSDACDLFCDIETIKDLEEETDTTNEAETASVYTIDRLNYLDANNEYDILDIIKEYSCDSINLACAIWYDNKVREAEAYETLKAYILE